VLKALAKHPGLRDLNAGIRRNEGYERSLAAERQAVTDAKRTTS